MLRYLEMGYEIGYFPAASIRAELLSQFAIDDIRRFWERTRSIQLAGVMNTAQRRFYALVEAAYAQAVEGSVHPVPVVSVGAPRPPSEGRRLPALVSYVAAGVAAAIAGQVIDACVSRLRNGV